jgi:hypothetical protein
VSDTVSFIEPIYLHSDKSIEVELENHKVDDAVTVDKKHSNDIQRSEEDDKQ